MPQGNSKIPGAATKTRHSQINKYIFFINLKGMQDVSTSWLQWLNYKMITIYKSYILWLHFLEYPNISERCIKIVINEMIWCQIFCLKKPSAGLGGRERWGSADETRSAVSWQLLKLVLGPRGLLFCSLHIFTSLKFYIIKTQGKKKKRRQKQNPWSIKQV